MKEYNDCYKKNFSFVIQDTLAGMRKPGCYGDLEEDLLFLKEHGIQAIVTLLPAPLCADEIKKHQFEYLHIPVMDYSIPTIDQVWEYIQFMNKNIQNNHPVVVHCYAGMGRTALFLACYLVYTGFSPNYTISYLKKERPGSFDTLEQEQFVYIWHNELLSKNTV